MTSLPLETRIAIALPLALAIVLLTTPVAIRVASRFQFYDRPHGYKGHAAPTPYLGGTPVVLGFLTAFLLAGHWRLTLPLVAGVGALWAVGTIDDRRNVPWFARVGVEVGLAALVWSLGHGWHLGLGGAVDLAVTVAWVVAVVNALNLFDNMDGAAGTIALVIATGLSVLGIVRGDTWLAVAGVALGGACLGFLPHNLARPARIFLGDGGSMPIGFAVATLTMVGATHAAPAGQALAMGVLLVGIPALDTALVIVSRTRRGISVLTGGRDHLTHRTLPRMRTARAVAVTLGATQAVISGLALVAVQASPKILVPLLLLYLGAVAVAIVRLDRADELVADVPVTEAPVRSVARIPVEAWLLVPAGIAMGVSPFFSGFYDTTVWGPMGLVLVVLATAAAIARPARLSAPAAWVVGSLGALGLLSVLSSSWADSAEQAVVTGNRYLTYAVALGLLLLLVRSRPAAVVVLGAFAGAALVVGAVDVVRLLDGHVSTLFLDGRLNGPLGYVNGQANFFLLALWPCVALAESRRSAWLSGAAMGTAALFGSLLLMSQSRGVVLALLVSAGLVLALVPGRLRRAWVLVGVGAAVAAAAPTLVHVYTTSTATTVSVGAAEAAGRAALIAAVAAGVVWGLIVALEHRRGGFGAGARTAGLAVLACGALALCVVALAKQATIRHDISRQYHAFVHLDTSTDSGAQSSRLLTGAGNRYDYWRVAYRTWKDHPLAGIGGGNYPEPYFRERRTLEDIRQPHSIELQSLAEMCVVGFLLLASFVVWVGVAAVRRRRVARADLVERGLLAAALGIFAAWFVHTSVDWMHLLPGLTFAALGAIAVLARRPEAATAPRAALPARRPRLVPAVAVAAFLAVAGVALARQVLADYFRTQAGNALSSAHPARAITDANRALRLDADDPSTYYVKAAAVARFGDGAGATRVLQQAIRHEPGNFVSYALLGDLYVRRGLLPEAKQAYTAAHVRNPRDPGLAALARNPRLAVSEEGG